MTRSYLTLPVFRRLLDGRQLTHRGCLHRRYHTARDRRTISRITVSLVQQRTLFNAFFRLPIANEKKVQDKYSGLRILQDLSRAELLDSRRPSEGKLRDALRQFIEEKQKRNEHLDEVTAGHILKALSWLKRQSQDSGKPVEGSDVQQQESAEKPWLGVQDARKIVGVLMLSAANDATKTHQGLALLVRDAVLGTLGEDGLAALTEQDMADVIRMLSAVGKPVEARDVLTRVQDSTSPPSTQVADEALIQVLDSLDAHDFPENEIEATRQLMTERNIQLSSAIRSALIRYYARRDALRKAIELSELPVIHQSHEADRPGIIAILESCIRLKDEQVGRAFLTKHLQDHSASPQMWTCVFQFASAVGRGPDEVDRMMTVMESRAQANATMSPLSLDIGMLNNLIKFAVDRRDPYLAERFIALGQKRGVQPDGLTFIYQMNYRLSTDDVDGAIAAYEQARGLPAEDEDRVDKNVQRQEIAAMNALIQAMCKVERRYSHQSIMRVVDDLNQKPKPSFHAATVADIAILHLRREEYHDVVDLLKSHTDSYNVDDRHVVRDAMVAYCFDLRNSTARVWDCYQIFRQMFDAETPRNIRTSIMNEFYRRRRADMGYYVFSHMRDSPDAAIRANGDTYVDALQGIAKCKDEETLEFVHNQLKLDTHLDLNTRLSNALMLAYISIGQPRRALPFWEDIVSSREGPSYNSILIALRACEESPFGIEQGNVIWDKLMELDVEVTREVYTAWCACLAGSGFFNQLQKMLQRADEFGIELDTWILGSIFNAAKQDPHMQRHCLDLLKEEVPGVAERLLDMPKRRERNGARRLKDIERTLEP